MQHHIDPPFRLFTRSKTIPSLAGCSSKKNNFYLRMHMIKDFNSFQNFLRAQKVFKRLGFKRIGVYGSFAGGEAFTDIDILLEDKINYEDRIALKEYLESELKIPIDIMMKDYAEPIILHRALKDIRYATRS